MDNCRQLKFIVKDDYIKYKKDKQFIYVDDIKHTLKQLGHSDKGKKKIY